MDGWIYGNKARVLVCDVFNKRGKIECSRKGVSDIIRICLLTELLFTTRSR